MNIFQTKARRIKGKEFKEVYRVAFGLFLVIKRRSKRKSYIRSAYFKKEKIFLHFFWEHMFQKENWRDRIRRLRFFAAALEVMSNSTLEPLSRQDPNDKSVTLHRFCGATVEGDVFFVQIKEEKKSSKKYLISIFPA